jgi:hypothetical protein
MSNIIDYLQSPKKLSWLVARQFKDRSTGDVYFVQQFPPGFAEGNERLFITYRDKLDDSGKRLTSAVWMNMHFFDREITGPFLLAQSSPKSTSSFSSPHNAIYRDMKRSQPSCTTERRTALDFSHIPVPHPIDLEGYFPRQDTPKKPRIC